MKESLLSQAVEEGHPQLELVENFKEMAKLPSLPQVQLLDYKIPTKKKSGLVCVIL